MTSYRPPQTHRAARPPAAAEPERQTAETGARAPDLLRVAGLSAVGALFKHAPDRVVRLFYEDRRVPDVGAFCARIAECRRPYRKVSAEELTKIAGTVLHGGVVAVAEPPAERLLTAAEARLLAAAHQPLVILDGVGNPHNVGAIARTLAFFGFRHLALSDDPRQAGLSDAAYRIAEGGLDCLTLYRARHLPSLLPQCKPHYRVVGTALSRRGQPLERLQGDNRPVAVLLGNEEAGLSPATLAACDLVVSLAGSGDMQSLNVSATAAILAYALRPVQPPSDRGRVEGGRKPGRSGRDIRPRPIR
jgi:RNA methyltransferase, TrmH family